MQLGVSVATSETGTEVLVQTSLGELKAREFGRRGNKVAIALHGAARANWVHHEWDHAAAALAERAGYHVFLPDLHGSPQINHRMLSPEKLLGILVDITRWAASSGGSALLGIPLLLGKSWGGGLAMQIAALPRSPVQRLVLVAPAEVEVPRKILCEAALFWNKDDASFWRASQVRVQLAAEVLFHTETTGGHRVLSAFTPFILTFAQRQASAESPQGPEAAALPLGRDSAGSFDAPRAAAPFPQESHESSKAFANGSASKMTVSQHKNVEAPTSADAGDKQNAGISWVWTLVLVPAFLGPSLFMLLPLRHVIMRAIEGSRRATAAARAEASVVGKCRATAPSPKVAGGVE